MRYESTNKAIFADFFPGEQSAGAFANVFVFGTMASTVAFTLGASSKETWKNILTSRRTLIGLVSFRPQDIEELYLLLIFALLTVPCYIVASLLRRCEAGTSVVRKHLDPLET